MTHKTDHCHIKHTKRHACDRKIATAKCLISIYVMLVAACQLQHNNIYQVGFLHHHSTFNSFRLINYISPWVNHKIVTENTQETLCDIRVATLRRLPSICVVVIYLIVMLVAICQLHHHSIWHGVCLYHPLIFLLIHVNQLFIHVTKSEDCHRKYTRDRHVTEE